MERSRADAATIAGARDRAPRILIVDDHEFARMGLVSAVRLLGCDVVEAPSAAAAIRVARLMPPDIAILDLDLGDGPTGIDLAHALRRHHPRIGLIIVSSYEDPRLLGDDQQRLPDDAAYLIKRAIDSPGVLGTAIRQVTEAGALSALTEPPPLEPSLATLSDQQVEIMRLVAAGCSNGEIARRRHLTEPAVAKAVARLIRHFDLRADETQNQRVLIAQLYTRLSGGQDARAR